MELDISLARRDVGVSVDRIAEYASVRASDLVEWERTGVVPPKYVHQVRWALWAAKRDVALAKAGLPECEALAALEARGPTPDLDALTRHLDSCELCSARSRYVDERVGPAPAIDGSWTMRAFAAIERLSGWQRSAALGATLIMTKGGIGAVVLLVMAVVNLNALYLVGAVAFVLLLALSGAAGGIVHYLTRSMREGSVVGHYLSCMITVYGYFVAVLALVALAAGFVGWELIGDDLRDPFTTPAGWIAFAVTGMILGGVFAHASRD